MRRLRRMAVASAIVLVAPVVQAAVSTAAPANAVVVWDLKAETAIYDIAQQAPPQVAGRSFAMVSGAVYDAVNAIAGKPYQPYLVAPRANGSESTDAAVATAATRVLTALFPAQRERLRADYDAWLAAIPDGRAKQGGIGIGDQTAAAMIVSRENDGAFGTELWPVGDEPGQWRPTPPDFANGGAWVAHLKPFVVPDISKFRIPGPPALTSRTYARDVDEVKLVGSATSTVRTADQTDAARWWHDRRSTAWEIKRNLATTQGLSVMETARLFAMVDITGMDNAIACSHNKEVWGFWRPITAIQLADTDGNPRTTADPNWTPLLVTPPFPEYPSGHACATAVRAAVYEFYFGRDDIAFSATSEATGTTRHFTSFSNALDELLAARVWAGVHYRFASDDGADLGQSVADYVTKHYFRPTR